MSVSYRSKRRRTIKIDGRCFEVEVVEVPFREGVELRCVVLGRRLSVSDLGLGEHEAIRLLEREIRAVLKNDPAEGG